MRLFVRSSGRDVADRRWDEARPHRSGIIGQPKLSEEMDTTLQTSKVSHSPISRDADEVSFPQAVEVSPSNHYPGSVSSSSQHPLPTIKVPLAMQTSRVRSRDRRHDTDEVRLEYTGCFAGSKCRCHRVLRKSASYNFPESFYFCRYA